MWNHSISETHTWKNVQFIYCIDQESMKHYIHAGSIKPDAVIPRLFFCTQETLMCTTKNI